MTRPVRLSLRQHELLTFLHSRQRAGHTMPTGREMAAAIGAPRPSGVGYLLDVLEARGFISRQPSFTRHTRVARMPTAAELPAEMVAAPWRWPGVQMAEVAHVRQ